MLDHAHARRIRHRRARHAGEDDAAHDVDMGEAAANPADAELGDVEDALRRAADIHQVAGEHEEGIASSGKEVVPA